MARASALGADALPDFMQIAGMREMPGYWVPFASPGFTLAVILLVGLVVGVVIGLFQALTSVQEMTLTFVPKVGLMLPVFWVTMSFMTTLLSGFFTDQILPLVGGG